MAELAQVNVMYVLDASVVIKWFSEEEYTDIAVKLRDDFFKGYNELVVPDLLLCDITRISMKLMSLTRLILCMI